MTKDDKQLIASVLYAVAHDYETMATNEDKPLPEGLHKFAKDRADKLRRLAEELENE